jgi:hypothetical protein
MLTLLTMCSGMTISGCDDSAMREVEFSKMIRGGAAEVKNALETVESNVNEFETKNWRDVVPEVQSSLSELRVAVEDLEKMLEPPDVN